MSPNHLVIPSGARKLNASDFFLKNLLLMKHSLCSWSGGKDSCFALIQAIHLGYSPKILLNVLNEEGKISRSHGIPSDILKQQAKAAGLPIKLISSSWNEYELHFTNALIELKDKYQLTDAVFGDIDLQAHRDWEEKVCRAAGLNAFLPLWKQNRKDLVMQMIESGIEAMIVSCNEMMGEKYIGSIITSDLVEELENMGIDACGENGEYHTLVLDCPLFDQSLKIDVKKKLHHGGYWFGELKTRASG
jgi:diphthine-ammonia ligase